MENTQLSLLNALFGGKPTGEALLPEKPFTAEGEAEHAPHGFFSFLESLTADAGETGKETLNGTLASKDEKSFQGLNVEVLKKLLGDEQLSGDETAIDATDFALGDVQIPATVDASSLRVDRVDPSIAVGVEGPVTTLHLDEAPRVVIASDSVDPVVSTPTTTSYSASVVSVDLALPFANRTISTPVDPVAGKTLGFVDPVTPSVEPVHAGITGGKAQLATTSDAAATAGQGNAVGSVEIKPVGSALSDQAAPVEPGIVDTGRRPELDPEPPQLKSPEGELKAHNKSAMAIGDHASPEALIHSALTRDGEPGIFERAASSRLETTSQAVDRNVHLNPVRDQIVAAVASRPGEAKLEIRLDPPELGRVLIGFERDGADIVRAVVTADSPDTLDLMRRNADVFQRALEQQGFSNLDLQFADRGAREDAQENPGEGARLFALADEESGASGLAEQSSRVPLGRLDRRL